MFSKRSLQVKMVKDPPADPDVKNTWNLNVNVKQMQSVAIIVGVVFVGMRLLDTACQIAIIKATPR